MEEAAPLIWVLVLILLLVFMGGIIPVVLSQPASGLVLTADVCVFSDNHVSARSHDLGLSGCSVDCCAHRLVSRRITTLGSSEPAAQHRH
jgi:hypothetical protein